MHEQEGTIQIFAFAAAKCPKMSKFYKVHSHISSLHETFKHNLNARGYRFILKRANELSAIRPKCK